MLGTLLLLAALAAAQTASGAAAGQKPAPAQAPGTVQTETQEEYAAYKLADAAATSEPDMTKAESAVAGFAAKYPHSRVTSLLYETLMHRYQTAGDNVKSLATARKVIELDPQAAFAMITAANVLAETTPENDPNWYQRYQETIKDADTAIQLIDSGAFRPPKLSPEQINVVKSMAYAAIGSIEFVKTGDTKLTAAELARHDAAAEQALRKATELNTLSPDPLLWLRMAVVLDHQKKYAEGLAAANRAVQLAAGDKDTLALATQEQSRLKVLAQQANKPPASKQR